MANETRRIKDLAVITSPGNNDIIPVDGSDNGTRGISFREFVNRIFNKVGVSRITGDDAIYSGVLRASNFITANNVSLNDIKTSLDEKANQTDVEVMQRQINNAISSVSSDAELVDIRIKADGTSAITAGAAVRDQVDDLQDQIDDINTDIENLAYDAEVLSDNVDNKVDTGYVQNGVARFCSGNNTLFSIPVNDLFIVNITIDDGSIDYVDKSYTQILEAYNAGKYIYALVNGQEFGFDYIDTEDRSAWFKYIGMNSWVWGQEPDCVYQWRICVGFEGNTQEFYSTDPSSIIAPKFNKNITYGVGSYCIYEGSLYRFTSIHSGNWNWNHVVVANIGNEIKEKVNNLQGQINNIDSDISDLEDSVSRNGISDDLRDALLQLAAKVAYIDDDGQDYYDALEAALYPPAELVSISAVYTQSGTVYPTTSLNSLKSDLVVTAHYTDSSAETVTTYTLSGTLTVGTSTVTVSYSGKTTTFTVTVTAAPTLSSISAVYTQSGTVYDTDSLDSLKTDLVVTATYSDTSTATVPSTDYTLSGTLTVGTSTVTVTYDGKTTTFTVTVTEASPIEYLYNWDFTQSLTDSVQNQEAVLRASGTAATRDGNGLTFNVATQNVYLGEIDMVGKTIEIDVSSLVFAGNTSYHIRFLVNAQYNTSTGYGLGAVIWRSGYGWTGYGYSADTGTDRKWSSSYYDGLEGTTSDIINAFSGKTIKVVFDSSGHPTLYIDGVSKGSLSDIYLNTQGSVHYSDKLAIGGKSHPEQSKGDQCYNMTITGVRIYANT